MTTIPPIGCPPAAITLFGSHSNDCVAKLNNDAINFNKKLNTTSQNLQQMLPGIHLVILDIYQPLYDLVTKPSDYGTKFNHAQSSETILLLEQCYVVRKILPESLTEIIVVVG